MASQRRFKQVGDAPTSERGYRLIQGRVTQVIPPEEAPEHFWGRMADITSGKYTVVIRQDRGSNHDNPLYRLASKFFVGFLGSSGDAVSEAPALVAEEFPYEEGDVIRVEADRVLPRWPDVCEPVSEIEEV